MITCVLLCVFVAGVLAELSFDYDFFFPGTDFIINAGNCKNDDKCRIYLVLKAPEDGGRVDLSNIDNEDIPKSIFQLKWERDNTYIMDNARHIADALEEGVYPDPAFLVLRKDNNVETQEFIKGFTFYKSQTFMGNSTIELNVNSSGVYSPSLDYINYRSNANINTHFNMSGNNANMYFKVNYDGVKKCDHLALYDGSKEGKVLSIPTVFNYIPKNRTGKIPTYFMGGNTNQFQTQFVSDSEFSYDTYAPILTYNNTENIEDKKQLYSFMDFTWNITPINDKDSHIDEGRVHFRRGSDINIDATLTVNDSFIEYLKTLADQDDKPAASKNLYFTFALCHINRNNDKWSYILESDCESEYKDSPPPYRCEISGTYDKSSGEMTYVRSESTRHVGETNYFNISKMTPQKKDGNDMYEFNIGKFSTVEANPIPFRIVPLVSVFKDEDETEAHYDFLPLGPASQIFEIDLDVTSAGIFFVIVFVVVVVICIIAYFVGKAIVKKVKSKKPVEAKKLDEVSENSNVSMVDTSGTDSYSFEHVQKKKKDPDAKDKLIREVSGSSSAKEGETVA